MLKSSLYNFMSMKKKKKKKQSLEWVGLSQGVFLCPDQRGKPPTLQDLFGGEAVEQSAPAVDGRNMCI